ncbi:MAG: hypothetical protein AB3N33_05775 [Puniceicoccaceae bacterium]
MKGEGAPRLADYLLVGVASAAVLSFEIILLRVFSFSQWHHFASLAVALALLGFGVAGTLLTLLGQKAVQWGDRLFISGLLLGAGGMVAASQLPRWILVRPLFALWDVGELLKLLLLDFIAFVPFLGLAVSIGQVFVRWPKATSRLYGVNLLGSGLGCLLPVILLATFYLEVALLLVPVFLLMGIAVFGLAGARAPRLGLVGLGGCLLLVLVLVAGVAPLRLSDFKQLAYLMDLPDARIVSRLAGIEADVTVVRSDSIRIGRGLSVQWPHPLPPVDAVVLEADTVIPLWRPGEAARHADYTRSTLMALPFLLRPSGPLAVLGASDWIFPPGDLDRESVLVENNGTLLKLYKERAMYPLAQLVQTDPRRYVEKTGNTFSLILLAGASMGGEAVDVDYLLTVEGLEACYSALGDDGVMVIPLHLSNPPRNAIRLLELLRTVLLRLGHENPLASMAMIRSMEDALILVFRETLTPPELEEIRDFCQQGSYDTSILPGLSVGETNRFHILEQPVYHAAAMALLSGEGSLPVEADWYSRDVPTDDRPHFWKTMRWSKLPDLLNALGRNGLIWLDWSILVSVVKFIVAAVLAGLLILLPLGRLPCRQATFGPMAIVTYFAALGMGFLSLEMVAFQRSMLFAGHPVIAAALVFFVFLAGAGWGSFSTPRSSGTAAVARVFLPIMGCVFWGWAILEWVAPPMLKISGAGCLGLVAVALGPMAYTLGRAFPWGLRQLRDSRPHIAWAWGINGFASVVAAPLAVLMAVHLGQGVVWGMGIGCYLVAGWIALKKT